MIRNIILSVLTIGLLCGLVTAYTYGQDMTDTQEESKGPIEVLREAQQRRKTMTAVEAYLLDDVLEVTVYATMYAARPEIYNITLVGPRLGRLSAAERQTLRATAEDKEMNFPTKDREGGFIRFTKRTKDKKIKGTLTKELARFKIPTERIVPNKRYELKIKLESKQSPGKFYNFKFDIEDLAGLLAQSASK